MYCVDMHIHVIQAVSPGVFWNSLQFFRFILQIISHATSQICCNERAQI